MRNPSQSFRTVPVQRGGIANPEAVVAVGRLMEFVYPDKPRVAQNYADSYLRGNPELVAALMTGMDEVRKAVAARSGTFSASPMVGASKFGMRNIIN